MLCGSLVPGQICLCSDDQIFFRGFERALHGLLVNNGLFQARILDINRKAIQAIGDLDSQIERTMFRSTTVLKIHKRQSSPVA